MRESLLGTSDFRKNPVYLSRDILEARLLTTADANTNRLARLLTESLFKS
ncbi:MAG: hypothetical protein V7K67_17085 [Nostoc sp.]